MKDNLHNKKVLCVGEILWDLLPSGAVAGGAPMNVALHLKKLGLDAKFAGRVGDDKLGESLKNFLKNQGMDLDLVQTDSQLPTSTVEVIIDSAKNARFDIIDNVAWDRIELVEDLLQTCKESHVLVFGTLASRHAITRSTISALIENSGLKLIDVNLRPPYINREIVEQLLHAADIAKLNDDELRTIAGWNHKEFELHDLTRWFADKFNLETVCVTRGDKGALININGELIEHPGYKVNVVDTVGAGDAFLAAFLFKYLLGEPVVNTLTFACATGALVASKKGGTPEYSIDEISRLFINNE